MSELLYKEEVFQLVGLCIEITVSSEGATERDTNYTNDHEFRKLSESNSANSCNRCLN